MEYIQINIFIYTYIDQGIREKTEQIAGFSWCLCWKQTKQAFSSKKKRLWLDFLKKKQQSLQTKNVKWKEDTVRGSIRLTHQTMVN